MSARKILFVASEAAPLVKTGGLGDVAGSLPPALAALGCDVRVIMPAYRQALLKCGPLTLAARIELAPHTVARVLEGTMPGSQLKLWLVDAPHLYDRPGGPYSGPNGQDWPDNAERFAVFARAVEMLALDQAGLGWRPDVVHCNDWQAGLAPALLSFHRSRPATVFTIHNLAYQGVYPADTYTFLRGHLDLPEGLMTMHGMEFHGLFSFIKGGLAYSDMLNTVSPTYAREIRTAEYGYGLEGLLNYRGARLRGILNGADYTLWDPLRDPMLARNYDATRLPDKQANKTKVQELFGLPVESQVPLLAMIGRLVEQKGGDLVLDALPHLLSRFKAQLVVLGTGDPRFEGAFVDAMARYPGRVATRIGFSEELAHLMEAGADMFLMPSRFEPCGLNQMYSLRYGTVPIVRRTGGLADTVIDTTAATLADGTATGFVFHTADTAALTHALERALELYARPIRWQQLMRRGMQEDFSWQRSAKDYLALYEDALRWRDKHG